MRENIIYRYPIGDLDISKIKVAVYRNLTSGKWSVKALEGVYKGKVILHLDNLLMNVTRFFVSEKGQSWVRLNKVKKVHAHVEGYIIDKNNDYYEKSIDNKDEIYYNPYTTDKFINKETGVEYNILLDKKTLYFSLDKKLYQM